MTDGLQIEPDETALRGRRSERVNFALRQAAFLGVALLVAGFVTERLRPVEVADRGLATTPFLWAVVVWLAVLLLSALAFDASPAHDLEGNPLYGGLAAGKIVFVVGLVGLEGETFVRRLTYAFGNALGAVMFWWGLLSLGYLVLRLVRADTP